MFSLRRTLHALPRHTAGRAFVARPVTRPVTHFFYSDSSSPAAQASTPAAENSTPATQSSTPATENPTPATADSTPASTPASTPENAKAAAPSTGTEDSGKGPGEKLADSLLNKTPPPPRKVLPGRRPVATPARRVAPAPVKKPAVTSAKKPEPAAGQTSGEPDKSTSSWLESDKGVVRAPPGLLKDTYVAKTVTTSTSKEHATENDIDVPWETSFHGISTRPVSAYQFRVLMRPIDESDIEVKPDGIIYLPEIKYRRRLNEAFGPMGWGMIPKGEPVVGQSVVTREYALIVDGRFVSQAQGENNYYSAEGLPSAVEGCKSNALMRCCKDLGIASDLWDPHFIRSYKKTKMEEVWVEHVVTKKKRAMWFKKGMVEVSYPFKRTGGAVTNSK